MTTHNKNRDYYTCSFCQNKYTLLQSKKRHIRSAHSQIKPYTCDICNKNFSRSETYEKHMQSQRHAHTLHATKTSKEVCHSLSLPSHSPIQSEPDSPEPIKNKLRTCKKSKFPDQKGCREAAKNADTGEKPKAGDSTQLKKTGTLNSEKGRNPTHTELPDQETGEGIAEEIDAKCPINDPENQEQSWANIEHERTSANMEALDDDSQHLQQLLTYEQDTTYSRMETFPSDQSNNGLFLNDIALETMACPDPNLMHQTNNDTDSVTSSLNYIYQLLL